MFAMKRILHVVLLVTTLGMICAGQIKNTENTLKLADGQTGEKAVIADIAWLAGNWIGTGLGGVSEEVWSKPNGGTMIGVYRLIKADKPVFYEMMLMLESEGTLILRLKHFNPSFVGWEEKDKSVDFKFVKKDEKRAYFSGLTFENTNAKELSIFLALRQKDGTLKEEAFKMKRSY